MDKGKRKYDTLRVGSALFIYGGIIIITSISLCSFNFLFLRVNQKGKVGFTSQNKKSYTYPINKVLFHL